MKKSLVTVALMSLFVAACGGAEQKPAEPATVTPTVDIAASEASAAMASGADAVEAAAASGAAAVEAAAASAAAEVKDAASAAAAEVKDAASDMQDAAASAVK